MNNHKILKALKKQIKDWVAVQREPRKTNRKRDPFKDCLLKENYRDGARQAFPGGRSAGIPQL